MINIDIKIITKKINEKAKELQNITEIIEEKDIDIALKNLNNLKINNIYDCLIYLSSLNLCNAYVKQTNSKIGYSFKKYIKTFIETINKLEIPNLYINKINNNGTLYIFQIENIQFSFHDEKEVEINNRYKKEIPWDGIKKQKCAKTIFYLIINNRIIA